MEAFLNLFNEIEEIKTGFSKDRLFKCTDEYGDYHLCRFFKIKNMGKASEQYEVLKALKGMSGFQQVEYILKCQDGEHGVLVNDWVDGIDLRDYLKEYPDRQYELGKQAGELLLGLHNLKIPHQYPISYQTNRLKKFENDLLKTKEIGLEFDQMDDLINQFHEHKSEYLVEQMVQCHGDFHSGNMVIDENNKITLIDFGSCHLGDPSDDLNALIFFDDIDFIKGVLDAYQPTPQILQNTRVVLSASPRSVLWATTNHGSQQVQFMIDLNQKVQEKIDKILIP